MLTQAQQTQITTLIRSGIAALQNDRPAEARDAIQKAIRLGADNAPTWLGMGMACLAMKDYDAAEKAAETSLEREPRNPRAALIKADCLLAKGDKRSAAAYYGAAVRMRPTPEHMTPDLEPELARAETMVKDLAQQFEAHINDRLQPHLDAAPPSARGQLALDILMGRQKVYRPEPHQFFFPDLPIRNFYDEAEFDWVPALEAKTDAIRAELQALLSGSDDQFGAYVTGEADRPHYDSHGMKGNTDWGAYYLWYNGEAVADNQARCPETVAAMEAVPLLFSGRRSPNVLFSRLKPGARIPPHTGMVNTRLICHLPLIVPDGCGFRVGHETREWQEGKVWMFDDTIEHEAWNTSDQERVILLFEVWKPELSDEERQLVTEIFASVDSYESAPSA